MQLQTTLIPLLFIFLSSILMSSSSILACFPFSVAVVDYNKEGDALSTWKASLADPNNLSQSWAPTLFNRCTWFHITCNRNNSAVRVDLANAELSGILVRELGLLTNLQYLVTVRCRCHYQSAISSSHCSVINLHDQTIHQLGKVMALVSTSTGLAVTVIRQDT